MLVNTSSVGESPSPVVQGFGAAAVAAAADKPVDANDVVTGNDGYFDQPANQPELKQIDEARFWQEMKLVAVMTELDDQRLELDVSLSEAKAKQEETESLLADDRAAVREIESQIKEIDSQFLDASRKLVKIAKGGALLELDKHTQPEGSVATASNLNAAEEDESWRAHPTSALLAVIPGVKKKKEMLIEVAPTVGQVQDMRQQASLDHKSFKSVMPKGCGESFADQVEDAVDIFIGRWIKQKNSPTEFADNLVAEIRIAAKNNGWTKDDCQPKDTDNEFVKNGFAAFNEGRPHTDVIPDNEHQAKQWMTGWVGGEVLKTLA